MPYHERSNPLEPHRAGQPPAPGGPGRGHESLSRLLRVCHPDAPDHDGGTKEDVIVPFLYGGKR